MLGIRKQTTSHLPATFTVLHAQSLAAFCQSRGDADQIEVTWHRTPCLAASARQKVPNFDELGLGQLSGLLENFHKHLARELAGLRVLV